MTRVERSTASEAGLTYPTKRGAFSLLSLTLKRASTRTLPFIPRWVGYGPTDLLPEILVQG